MASSFRAQRLYDLALTTEPYIAALSFSARTRTTSTVTPSGVFAKLGQLYGRGGVPFGRFAPASVFSLVPIAIAYQVAHYYTLLLV